MKVAAALLTSPSPPARLIIQSQYTVLIDYKSDTDKDVVNRVAIGLRDKGYVVPDTQLVTQQTSGDVRYYRPSEQSDAKLLKQNVEGLIGSKQMSLKLLDISKTYPNLPSGIMEVWIPDLHSSPKNG